MNKKLLQVLLLLLPVLSTPSAAQTRVVKLSAAAGSGQGITYFLPKTVLTVRAGYAKITRQAGPYAQYAGKFLGLEEQGVIVEDGIEYRLDKVSVTGRGVPDKRESYLVSFKAKTTAPFVYLSEEGVICAINAEYVPAAPVPEPVRPEAVEALPAVDVRSLFSEAYLRAGSRLKRAEIAARQIYQLRESRNELLRGEAENAPRDGEGMKLVLATLEAQEKALTALFTGTVGVEPFEAVFETEPRSEESRETLFRFSRHTGPVAADDLSGSPVGIRVTKTAEGEVAAEADPKKKAKAPESIVYNVPGKAFVEIFYGAESLYGNTLPVAQFGERRILAPSLFEDRKSPVKVYFYPDTGAVRQIIQ